MQSEIPSTGAPSRATARDFVAILFRRRALILGLFAVTTATVLLLGFTASVTYFSAGRVLVKRGVPVSALSPERRLYSDWEEDMGSEVEMIKSTPVLDRARAILAEEAGPGRTAPPLSPSAVDVEIKGRTNVLAVGYSDADPLVAKKVCEAVLRAYVEFKQNHGLMEDSRTYLEGEMEKIQKDLDHWIVLRRDYAERSNVVDLPQQKLSDISRLSSIRQQLNDTDADLAEATTSWKRLSAVTEQGTIDQPSFSMLFSEETALIELKRRVVEQELRVATLREKLRDDAPEVVAAEATLDTLQGMMQREIRSRAEAAHTRVEMLQARHASIQQQISTLEQGLASIPGKEFSLAEMDHRIDLLKIRFKDLSESNEKARITDRTSPTDNVVLLAHATDARPLNTRDYVRLALGPAFSLVVGIGLAFFFDGLDLTVHTAHHVEEAIELPVLATLAERRSRRRRTLEPERAAS